jgi:hypothetical protein
MQYLNLWSFMNFSPKTYFEQRRAIFRDVLRWRIRSAERRCSATVLPFCGYIRGGSLGAALLEACPCAHE